MEEEGLGVYGIGGEESGGLVREGWGRVGVLYEVKELERGGGLVIGGLGGREWWGIVVIEGEEWGEGLGVGE